MGPDKIIRVGPKVLYYVHIRAAGWPVKGGNTISSYSSQCCLMYALDHCQLGE